MSSTLRIQAPNFSFEHKAFNMSWRKIAHRASGELFTSKIKSVRTKRLIQSTSILRQDSTSNQTNVGVTPLSQPLPGYTRKGGGGQFDPHTRTQVTKLENGLTVASEDHWGQFATLGVLTNAGSRNEIAYMSGINHFLEKLAFNSTSLYSGGREDILQLLEKHGGICDCQSSRDTLIHAISLNKNGLDTAVQILSEVALQPLLTQEEITLAQQAVAFELENIYMNPNKEMRMLELIHAAAYSGNTLGLPKLCPPENIEKVNRDLLFSYMRSQLTPDEMVLAGSGMSHDHLVELARKYFLGPPVWSDMKLDSRYEKDISHAQYTGGVVAVSEDLSNVSLGPNPMPELAHVSIGLESCSHRDDDFVAYCVLNTLMGGGGSFSAGGPGKGMYTRLYTNVLNRYYWIENATAFNHAYNDSGLFVFYGSAHPSQLADLVMVLTAEIKRMTQYIESSELDRAKRQLQSMLMMNLESRPVIFEDVGRQVLATGERKPPQYFYNKIGQISEADIKRVARRLLQSRPSLAALGTLDRLPDIGSVQDMLTLDKAGSGKLFQFGRS